MQSYDCWWYLDICVCGRHSVDFYCWWYLGGEMSGREASGSVFFTRSWRELSGGQMSASGFFLWGDFPGRKCPGGNCPWWGVVRGELSGGNLPVTTFTPERNGERILKTNQFFFNSNQWKNNIAVQNVQWVLLGDVTSSYLTSLNYPV